MHWQTCNSGSNASSCQSFRQWQVYRDYWQNRKLKRRRIPTFQCFQMVPVSCSSGGANKNVPPKTTPMSHRVRLNHPQTTASLHEVVRSCNLKHWISIVDSLVYKTAGKVGTYSFLFVGKRLWKLTGRQGAINQTLEFFVRYDFRFFNNHPYTVTGGTTVSKQAAVHAVNTFNLSLLCSWSLQWLKWTEILKSADATLPYLPWSLKQRSITCIPIM